MSEVTVRPFRDGDEQAVLELLRTSLGEGPTGERSPEFFRWKHRRNPFGGSFMLLAESGGSIVGLRAFMRWRFEGTGGTVRAVRAVDTATHPRFQGRGVFSRLTREALDALEDSIDLVFNTPNEKSGPGYLKLGWRRVGRLPVWVRPRLRALRPGRGSASPPPPVDAPSAAEALSDQARIGELLERQGEDDGRLRTARDAAYLTWRYAEAPGLRYHAVREEIDGRLHGLALFRVRRRKRRWECSVAETIVAPTDRGAGGRLLRKVVAASRTDHLAGLFPAGSAIGRAAPGRGFVPVPYGPTLMVRMLGADVTPDATTLSSWALSLGDVEVF